MWHFKLSDVVQVVYLPVQLISLLTIRLKAPLRDRKGETIWFVFFLKTEAAASASKDTRRGASIQHLSRIHF